MYKLSNRPGEGGVRCLCRVLDVQQKGLGMGRNMDNEQRETKGEIKRVGFLHIKHAEWVLGVLLISY